MKIKVVLDHRNGKSKEVEIDDNRVDIFDHLMMEYVKYLEWKYGHVTKST